jgi:predicted nucleotidyltransferase
LTGRQVARLVRRGSQPAVNAALDRLAMHGLVRREEAPPAILHTLNRSHVGAAAVEALAGMRTEFLRRLRSAFASWNVPPVHASLFGSAARADGDVESDIDLLVVRPRGVNEGAPPWRSQVAALQSAVSDWTGNRASIIELPEARVRPGSRGLDVLSEVQRDGIHLSGQSLDALLAA